MLFRLLGGVEPELLEVPLSLDRRSIGNMMKTAEVGNEELLVLERLAVDKPMRRHSRNPFLLAVMVAGLNVTHAEWALAQSITTLHSFTLPLPAYHESHLLYTNSDGAYPYAGLALSGDTLYGTAFYGGGSSAGTIFAVNTDGTGFTTLHSFT